MHTVRDFYLDLLVSLVRKEQLLLLFIYCIYVQCQAKVLNKKSQLKLFQAVSLPPYF